MALGDSFSSLTGVSRDSALYRTLRASYRKVHPRQYFRPFYSQFGEDVVLTNLVGLRVGTYVDVGAGHPMVGSNTYLLYRLGWSGITVDPVRRNNDLAAKARPRDRQVLALCGRQKSEQMLFEYETYELSTTSQARVEELGRAGVHPVREFELETIPLRSLGLKASPQDAAILSIDVEGSEMDVLDGNDWSSYLPALICCEEWQSPLRGKTEIQSFLGDRGYRLEAYLGLSSVYLHEDSGLGL